MSDDLLRDARQFLAELQASETHLRAAAVMALPYANVLAAERRATKRCAELLASLGGPGFELAQAAQLGDETTDELLRSAVRARDIATPDPVGRQARPASALGPADSIGAQGAPADLYEDLPPLVEDDDTDETPLPAPVPAASEVREAFASDALVSFDDPPPSDDEPTLGDVPPVGLPLDARRESAAPEPDVDVYVSFEESPPEDDSAETIISTDGRTPARFTDVGADALVTVEERSTDLLVDSFTDEEIEELELDNSDSFDLLPDVGDEDSLEDDEVTMIKAGTVTPDPDPSRYGPGSSYAGTEVTGGPEHASRAPVPRRPLAPRPVPVTPTAIGGKTTAGLYGGASVPMIRDSEEPRPRAAAIQLNPGGAGGKVLGLEEEEEPIEIGAAEDYGDEEAEADLADGFSVTLQAHDEPEYEDDDEEDDEVIEPLQDPGPPPGPTPEELRAMLDRAHAAAATGDLQGGADLFSDALDLDPDCIEAHVSRGRLHLDLGDYSRAMSDFMVAEDIAPNDPEPQVAIGDLYFARKDYRKAIDYFNAALELSPNHAMAYCRRGISHYYRKNYQEAVGDLLKAEKLDPEIPNIQTYVSMARKKVKR